jgi:hypothetical protein
LLERLKRFNLVFERIDLVMGLCLQCNKWISQPDGKRAKLFCNNTCRSNYWYSKNKKGKPASTDVKVTDLTKPTDVLKPYEPAKSNYSINTFSKPSRVEIEAIKHKYVEERRECNGAEDYFDWIKRVEADDRLSKNDKDLVKNTH